MVETYKTRGVVLLLLHQDRSSKNHLLVQCESSIIISEHGSRNSSKVHFKITFSSTKITARPSLAFCQQTISDWLSRRTHQHRKIVIHPHTNILWRGHHAFAHQFFDLQSSTFSALNFRNISSAILSGEPSIDYFGRSIHRPIHRTFQKIYSSKHFSEPPIINPSRRSFQFIDPFRPSIHRSIQRTVHRSTLDHLSRRPFTDPARGPFIDPSSKTHSYDPIQTTGSFLSWSYQHAFQSSPTDESSAFQRQITFEESTDTKVELNIIIFYNTKKVF